MARIEDVISPAMKERLDAITEAKESDPDWLTTMWFKLREQGLSDEETLNETVRAWERKKSRERVEEAKRSQNQKQHERLVKKHRNWSHLIDPERGE